MSITYRESEVLQLIAHEHTNPEIAAKLYISTHTVISHRRTLLIKLKAKNAAGLIRRAFELGYLPIDIAEHQAYAIA